MAEDVGNATKVVRQPAAAVGCMARAQIR